MHREIMILVARNLPPPQPGDSSLRFNTDERCPAPFARVLTPQLTLEKQIDAIARTPPHLILGTVARPQFSVIIYRA